MTGFTWEMFLLIGAMAFVGAMGVIPLATQLIGEKVEDLSIPAIRAASISALQGGLLAIGATAGGLVFAEWAGFRLPVFEAIASGDSIPSDAWGQILIGLALGALSIVVALVLEWKIFWQHLPKGLREGVDAAVWKRLAATLYGSITEEVITRLFFLSMFAWALSFIWSTTDGHAAEPAIWIAIILSALVFGLLHLPATALFGPVTTAVVVRTLALNGVVGIAAGWLFTEYGLVPAMAAHWAADIGILIVAPSIQKRLEETGFLKAKPSDSAAGAV